MRRLPRSSSPKRCAASSQGIGAVQRRHGVALAKEGRRARESDPESQTEDKEEQHQVRAGDLEEGPGGAPGPVDGQLDAVAQHQPSEGKSRNSIEYAHWSEQEDED